MKQVGDSVSPRRLPPPGGESQVKGSGRQPSAVSRKFLVLGGAAAITLLLYIPTLWYGFVWDDGHLISNNTWLARTNPVEIFTKGFWYNPGQAEDEGDMSYYRPLTNLSYFFERKEFELNPAGYHLTNILIHAVIVFLLGLVLYELFGSVWLAGMGGLLFGINPAQNCIVTFIAGRTYLLAVLFILTSLLALLRGKETPGHASARHRNPKPKTRNPKWVWPLLLGATFLLAALALEAPLGFAALALGWLLLNRRQYPGLMSWLIAILFPIAVYLLLRLVVAGIPLTTSTVGRWAAANPLRVINTFGQQLLLFFVPFNQKVIYTVGPVFTSFSIYTVFGFLFLLAPLVPIVVQGRHGDRPLRATLGYAWMVLFLLPFANLLFLGPSGRMLYLASPGILILAAALTANRRPPTADRPEFSAGSGERQAAGGKRLALLVLFGLYGLALTGQLLRRNELWRNELTLSIAMVEDAPDSPGAHLNLGAELAKRGQPDAAAEQYQLAIEADSDYVSPHNRLAFALVERGDLDAAADEFRAVARIEPSADAFNNLALTLKKAGKVDSAIVEYREALRLAPDSDTTLNNLGRAFGARGDVRSAIEAFKQVLARNPNFEPARENLIEIYQALGFRDSAVMLK
jgi:protein O-mannosyl-transferase